MSIAGLSSGALFAKVKACSTALLTDDDYMRAASCENLSDFASYLKNKTAYSEAFEGLGSANKGTRQQLEAIIKRMTLLRLEKIIRYASLSDNYISEYFMMKHEIKCIISRLRQHGEYTLDSYLLYMPDGYFTETGFDIKALEHASSAKEICEILRKTEYYDFLAPVLEKAERGKWVPENLLYRHLYETGAKNFEKKLSGGDFADVRELLSMLSDMLTVGNIYRIKKYYPDGYDALTLNIFESNLTKFTKNQLHALKASGSIKEFTDRISETCYRGIVPLLESERSALFTKQYVYNSCRKSFARSSNPALSALCYGRIINVEADNLITIAEGVSCGENPEKIMGMLVR